MSPPPVGAHIWGEDPIREAEEVGVPIVQLFISDPQGWKAPPPRDDEAELRSSELGIYVHAPYLINVCSPKPNVRYGSRKILQQTCEGAAAIGAEAVIVHPGHAEDGLEEGRRPLGPDARDARVRGARSTSRTRPVARTPSPAASTRWRSSGRSSRRARPTSRSASASTPAMRTPPAKTSPTLSSGRSRSPAASTCSTSTTRAIRPGPAPTATRTSARATSTSTSSAT